MKTEIRYCKKRGAETEDCTAWWRLYGLCRKCWKRKFPPQMQGKLKPI